MIEDRDILMLKEQEYWANGQLPGPLALDVDANKKCITINLYGNYGKELLNTWTTSLTALAMAYLLGFVEASRRVSDHYQEEKKCFRRALMKSDNEIERLQEELSTILTFLNGYKDSDDDSLRRVSRVIGGRIEQALNEEVWGNGDDREQ